MNVSVDKSCIHKSGEVTVEYNFVEVRKLTHLSSIHITEGRNTILWCWNRRYLNNKFSSIVWKHWVFHIKVYQIKTHEISLRILSIHRVITFTVVWWRSLKWACVTVTSSSSSSVCEKYTHNSEFFNCLKDSTTMSRDITRPCHARHTHTLTTTKC